MQRHRDPFDVLVLFLATLAVLWICSFSLVLAEHLRQHSLWQRVDLHDFWAFTFFVVPLINFFLLGYGTIRRKNMRSLQITSLLCWLIAASAPVLFIVYFLLRVILGSFAGL